MSLREKSDQYRVLLAQTCRSLCSSRIVRQNAPDVAAGAGRLLDILRIIQRTGRRDFTLALDPNWKIEIDAGKVCSVNGHAELHFGGEIIFEDNCLKRQVLTVVILFQSDHTVDAIDGRPNFNAGEYYVVRRFHFDFDSSVSGQGKPLAHIQIGGQLSRERLAIDDDHAIRYELFDQLDEPRLPWTITDVAIVMHTFLRQFPSGLEEMIGGADWLQRVMDSEQLWLADFYRDTATMMDGHANRACFFDYICDLAPFDR